MWVGGLHVASEAGAPGNGAVGVDVADVCLDVVEELHNILIGSSTPVALNGVCEVLAVARSAYIV